MPHKYELKGLMKFKKHKPSMCIIYIHLRTIFQCTRLDMKVTCNTSQALTVAS